MSNETDGKRVGRTKYNLHLESTACPPSSSPLELPANRPDLGLDVAVLASWDATALDNFAAAAWATENDGVSALGPLDGELIKSVDGTPRLEDAGTGRLSEVQGADLEGRHVTHADVISDGSNNHGHLVSPVFHLFDEGLEGDGDFVGTAVVKSLQDNLVEP